MITRKQYLNREKSHREYYAQFVSKAELGTVRARFGADKIQAALAEDKNLNSLPLSSWDALPQIAAETREKIKECGDFHTKAGHVCIYKEAARQLVEKGGEA
jgi:hypothetical protein